MVPGLRPAIAAAAQNQPTRTETCTLKITGMTCGGCAVSVKMAAKNVKGVSEAKVSYENGRAEVTYDPAKTTPEKIATAITQNSGFKAEPQPSVKK
ncbi:MAG: heavy-metal-associated domain-containing protein [Solirubrobacterales bacterium]|nr:heavy-metal-associated domain-containing protein [Solirubrobacterales bacterium]